MSKQIFYHASVPEETKQKVNIDLSAEIDIIKEAVGFKPRKETLKEVELLSELNQEAELFLREAGLQEVAQRIPGSSKIHILEQDPNSEDKDFCIDAFTSFNHLAFTMGYGKTLTDF